MKTKTKKRKIKPTKMKATTRIRLQQEKARREKIIASYKGGLSLLDVATKHGITKSRVHQIIYKFAPAEMRQPYLRYERG